MLDDILIRQLLDEMGIEWPSDVADPTLGDDLAMDTLEIKRLRQLIEIRLDVRLPDGLRFSRKDTVQGLIATVNTPLPSAHACVA